MFTLQISKHEGAIHDASIQFHRISIWNPFRELFHCSLNINMNNSMVDRYKTKSNHITSIKNTKNIKFSKIIISMKLEYNMEI